MIAFAGTVRSEVSVTYRFLHDRVRQVRRYYASIQICSPIVDNLSVSNRLHIHW
jgi:hypothetical protein